MNKPKQPDGPIKKVAFFLSNRDHINLGIIAAKEESSRSELARIEVEKLIKRKLSTHHAI